MIDIYLAGPFFNDTERKYIEEVRDILRKQEHNVFVPMEYIIPNGEVLPNHDWASKVFHGDVKHLRECELVVAVYHGHYSDTGTAWEIGYAYAKQIPVLLVHVDKTITASIMPVNSCMMNITIEDLRKISVESVFKPAYSALNTFLVEQK